MNSAVRHRRLKRWAVSLLGVCMPLEAIIVIALSILIRECIVNTRADKFDTTLVLLAILFSLVLGVALATVSFVLFKVIKALQVPFLTVSHDGEVEVPDGFALAPPNELIPPWDRYLQLSFAVVRLHSTLGSDCRLFVMDRTDLAKLLRGHETT